MVEYLYDAIKASRGADAVIMAKVSDGGVPITEGVRLGIYDEALIVEVAGVYMDNAWVFEVPAEVTKKLSGRYFYDIFTDETTYSFKQPIYFI